MVMFKAKFRPEPTWDKPQARATGQQQQQPQPTPTPPPIEKEQGPQYPIKEPGPGNPPERAR